MPQILLVDDDMDVRDTLQELLDQEGFDVRTASNGAEALGFLEQRKSNPPDLILLDIMMPVMDGRQFLERYAQRPELPPVPVIVMSAQQVRDSVARDERVVVQLHKPVDVDRLVSILGRWCPRDTMPPSPAPDTSPAPAALLPPAEPPERSFAWLPIDPHPHAACARRVLIVEDDEDVRESVAEVLRDDGYQVESARNGAEAITMLSEGPPPCVVLLDLMMPVMTGWELIDRIRGKETLSNLPVVVTSAAAERPPPGVDRVLPKPVDLDAMLAAVGQFCSAGDGRARERDAALRELARRNIELVELQRFREEMSALIVHDMKSPLMAITGNLHYVLGGPLSQDEPDKREALEETRDAADHLTRLIENLLHLVKLESGRFLPQRSPATLRSIVAPLARRRATQARDYKLTVQTPDVPDASLSVDVDLVTRALDNIIDNAFRYTPCGGRVCIDAEVFPASVRIRIGNTGKPVPLDARQRIFDKFGQVANGNGKVNIGLGLYFCRLVAEAHGGSIRVEQTEELPTVFTLELPRAAPVQRVAS